MAASQDVDHSEMENGIARCVSDGSKAPLPVGVLHMRRIHTLQPEPKRLTVPISPQELGKVNKNENIPAEKSEKEDEIDPLFDQLDICDEEEPNIQQKFTDSELDICIKVLKSFEGNIDLLKDVKYRALRTAGRIFFEATGHKSSKEYKLKRGEKARSNLRRNMENRRKMMFRNLDKKKTEAAALRAERVRQLNALIEVKDSTPLLPAPESCGDTDGAIVLPSTNVTNAYESHVNKIQEYEYEWEGGGRVQKQDGVVSNMVGFYEDFESLVPAGIGSEKVLMRPKACYICKSRFIHIHHFYDQLCPKCADLNWKKRNKTTDLSGKIILLTGSRIKIGHEAGLKLLRAGATLIATSRFPKDCVMRYYKHKDSSEWMHRLHVYGIDLRDLPAIHGFCEHVKKEYIRLDGIVNNAAQTVRRPPVFYSHLLPVETTPFENLPSVCQDSLKQFMTLDPNMSLHCHLKMLADSTIDIPSLHESAFRKEKEDGYVDSIIDVGMKQEEGALDKNMVAKSVALSQVSLVSGDNSGNSKGHFPEGQFDKDAQQVDKREKNSWTMLANEVPLPELVEVHAINSMAPFALISNLYDLLCARPEGEESSLPRYIVNVSAMEAKFYRYKTPYHPHTNMAKAALNMMTRTSASKFAEDHVYMNSVDTGWITDEKPLNDMLRVCGQGLDPCALDEVDAAARILDPIISGFGEGFVQSGQFFKDYSPTEW